MRIILKITILSFTILCLSNCTQINNDSKDSKILPIYLDCSGLIELIIKQPDTPKVFRYYPIEGSDKYFEYKYPIDFYFYNNTKDTIIYKYYDINSWYFASYISRYNGVRILDIGFIKSTSTPQPFPPEQTIILLPFDTVFYNTRYLELLFNKDSIPKNEEFEYQALLKPKNLIIKDTKMRCIDTIYSNKIKINNH